ncbi:MAG: hypothetical protein V7727_07435 [Sneathiella sp.]
MDEFGFSLTVTDFESIEGLSKGESVTTNPIAQRSEGIDLRGNVKVKPNSTVSLTKTKSGGDFYNTALRILYTLTPAILILNIQREIVYANRDAEKLLKAGDVISLDKQGHICCVDPVAQNFLSTYVSGDREKRQHLFSMEDESLLIPKKNAWPMVAILGKEQLQLDTFRANGWDTEKHITLLIRDENGRHPEQSKILMTHLGLNSLKTRALKIL